MSILSNNKKDGKKGNKNAKNNVPGAKFAVKTSGKSANVSKKMLKTGGSRGS